MNTALTGSTASLERVLLAALLGVALLEVLWVGLMPGQIPLSEGTAGVWVSSVLAALLCLLAALRTQRLLFWGALGLGLLISSLGLSLDQQNSLNHLGFLLCLAVALLGYPHRLSRPLETSALVLDVGILAQALLTGLGYVLLLEGLQGLPPLLALVDLGAAVVLLSLILMLALRRVGEALPLELLLVALALTLHLGVDLLPQSSSLVGLHLLLVGGQFLVIGLAADRGGRGVGPLDQRRDLSPSLDRALTALPYLATLVSLLLALYAQATAHPQALLLALGAAGVVLLALARQSLTLYENRLLSQQIRQAHLAEKTLLENLSSSESRYQSLVENSSDLVQIISPLGRVLYASPSHRERLGFEVGELLEQQASLLLHPDDFGMFRPMLQQAAVSQALTPPTLYRVRHRAGGWRWLEAVAKGMLDVEGIGGIVINARDVTEREEALERVRGMSSQLEARLERITALHTIDLAISSRLPLRVTLEMVLAQVNTHLGVEASAVRLRQRGSGPLELFCGLGFRSESAREQLLELGGRWADNVLLEGKPLGARLSTDALSGWSAPSGGIRYFAAPLVIEGQTRGVLEVYQKGDTRREREWHNFLETLAAQAALALENDTLLSELRRGNRELTAAYNEVIEGWARALDLRDKETEGHSRRVTDLAVRLAVRMNLSGEALVHLRRGALLHDIGKMGIPDRILHKPGPLDPEEWTVMRTHPGLAHALLTPLEFLRPALDIPLCHHEKWDGSGYPRGLRGLDIPLSARIFAVVDVWDALTSDRPYHTRREPEEALCILLEGVGQHFDPEVVRCFLTLEEIAPLYEALGGSKRGGRILDLRAQGLRPR